MLSEKPIEEGSRKGAAIRLGWKTVGVVNLVKHPIDAVAAQAFINPVSNVKTVVTEAPVALAVHAGHGYVRG